MVILYGLVGILIVLIIGFICYSNLLMKSMDNVSTNIENMDKNEGERKVFIPDNVDANDASEESTQNVDCKTINVADGTRPEKIVVTNENTEV